MLSNKFKINKVDKCIYVKNIYKCYVIVCFYVNDMLILSNNDCMIKCTKKIWTNKIVMKYLSVVDVILRTKITKKLNELVLYQFHFVETVLNKFCKGNNSNMKTLMDMIVYMSKNKRWGNKPIEIFLNN